HPAAFLYPMPWRPLILSSPVQPYPTPPSGLSQLSPGYTGPQTFPQAQEQAQQQQQQPQQQQYLTQQQQQYPQQPVFVGLFTPQLQVHPLAAPPQAGHFSLPFRPSPFAGYTDEEDEDQQRQQQHQHHQENPPQQQQQQQQQQQLEPPFYAQDYRVGERSEGARGPGAEENGPMGYVYLSPSNLYNLVRT
ncbi:hypothetical protein KR018_008957, partial [Drosophila ironensis]